MKKVRFYISICIISLCLVHSQKLSAGTLRVIPYTVIAETEAPVTLMNFSPDGSKLFGVSDKTVIIWDAGTWEESNQIKEDNAAIRVLKFSPDSGSILTVLDDNSVVVRDYNELWELVRIQPDAGNPVLGADFLSDRYTLAAPLNGKTLSSCFVLIITEKIMPSQLADFDSTVCSVEADSTGNRLLITLSDGSVHFVNAAAKTAETVLEGSSDFRLGASFVPGDETFLCLADGNVIIARTVSGTELFRIDLPEVPAGRITYSPDGKAFAVRTESGMVNLFDCQTGMPLLSVQGPESSKAQCTILDAVFSPDGNYLYTSLDDGRLIRWTLNSMLVAEMGEGPFTWEQREGEEWAYQLPYAPEEAKTDNNPSAVLVLGAGYSLVQQSYYTGSIDVDTWFHKRIGASDFMWGVEVQFGVSKPTDDYPYKYIFSDNTPLLTPRLYTIQTLASLSYNLSSDSNTRVFFGVVAGPAFRFLWNNNMKRSVQTKLYPSLDIGVDGGLDYKGLTVTVAYIYNTQIGLQPSFQLGYAFRFGSGGKKNEE